MHFGIPAIMLQKFGTGAATGRRVQRYIWLCHDLAVPSLLSQLLASTINLAQSSGGWHDGGLGLVRKFFGVSEQTAIIAIILLTVLGELFLGLY